MDKRYQVFVSSTYADLKDERQRVIQTLMEMDCIPAGMELFPAADEEQFEFIKKVIDDSDYYLLIIGGRYGSLTLDGVSYTEKEYEYAIKKGLKVIALLHESPEDIPIGKSEKDPDTRAKLQTFREKVADTRIVKFWKKAEELPGIVSLSLNKTIKMYPATGWARSNLIGSEQLLNELHESRDENLSLKNRLSELEEKPSPKRDGLAGFGDLFELNGTYKIHQSTISKAWKTVVSWRDIFTFISPHLTTEPSSSVVASKIERWATERDVGNFHSTNMNENAFHIISIQLKALGLVRVDKRRITSGEMAFHWSLTEAGERLMVELLTVKVKS